MSGSQYKWDYFILRASQNNYGETGFYVGDTDKQACPPGTDEKTVLNTFGSHGYELIEVVQTRFGDIKYYFKRYMA